MVDYEYSDLFTKDRTDKQLSIVSDDGLINITNEELHQQQFELTESLCSESELRFGSCETGMIKFTISNTFIPLTGKWITVTMVVEGHTDKPFQIGRYKVFSDTVTADRTKRDIIAYDAMYDIINADMASWYNKVFPEKDSTLKLKQFRTSLMNYFGLEQVVPKEGLVNDNMLISKTIAIAATEESETEYEIVSIAGETLSGMDIITAICEINGCFGHIGRDGKFHYIYLPQGIQGLYPADFLYPDHVPEKWDYLPQAKTGHLYPQDPKSINLGNGNYISCKYEDYVVRTIDKLQIRQEEGDIGVIVGNDAEDNSYVIENNFLVYGKGDDELRKIAANILGKITDIIYRPYELDVKGNPCLEVGDPIRVGTKYEIVESYILRRTLKGIQALRDDYAASGTERYTEQVNGMHKSILQLKGKANILTRNLDETRLEMVDMDKNIRNEIKITAEGLQANIDKEVTRATGEEVKLSNNIKITAEGLQANITKEQQRAEGEEAKLSSSIVATAEEIKTTVAATYETKNDAKTTRDTLQSSITQNAESIATEVKRATAQEGSLSSRITQNAESITTKVARGAVSSEISQEADKITISGDRIAINSTNMELTEDGKLTIKGNGLIKGTAIEGSTFYSKGNNGAYVQIANGVIRGGLNNTEAGRLDFSYGIDGKRSIAMIGDNMQIIADDLYVGVENKTDGTQTVHKGRGLDLCVIGAISGGQHGVPNGEYGIGIEVSSSNGYLTGFTLYYTWNILRFSHGILISR